MFNLISSLGIGAGQSIWNIIINIFSFIPKLMYLITTSFFSILDVLQLLFRKLAGLDSYYIQTGGIESVGDIISGGQTVQQTGDIVEEFILGIFTNKYPILYNVFWSFIILGVVMLFLTTLIALIRNEYTPEKDGSNSKSKVIGRSIKALLSFAIVPVVVFFGVYLCNILLRALDAITSGSSTDALGMPTTNLAQYSRSDDGGGNSYIAYSLFGFKIATNTTPFSGVAFKASAYRANRARLSDEFVQLLNNDQGSDNYITNWSGTFIGPDAETVATYIDNAFANNVQFSNPQKLSYNTTYQKTNNVTAVDIISGSDILLASTVAFRTLDRYRVGVVWYYYDLWQFDFLVAWAIVISMLTVFINIIFGLMKRFFEVIGLFLVSPPVVALMPLDDGAAFGKWKGRFISKMLGAYGAVVGMNIMFIILPYIYRIKFFNIGIVDAIIQSLFIIVGLVSVKSFIALMSEIAGGDDVQKAGVEIAKEVGATVQKAGAAAVKVAGLATGFGMATSAVGWAGSALATNVGYDNRQESRQARIDSLNRDIAEGNGDTDALRNERNEIQNDMQAATNRHNERLERREDRRHNREQRRFNRRFYNQEDVRNWAAANDYQLSPGLQPSDEATDTGSVTGGATSSGTGTGASAGGGIGGAGGSAPVTGGATPSGAPVVGAARARGGFRRFASRAGRNLARSGLNLLKGMGGLFMDVWKGTDFYKGWDEAGGADGIMIYARGGGAGDVKAYRAAKDHYKARAAAAAVEGAGEFLRDPNGNLIPERNADGTVRRELRPRLDASGNPERDAYGEVIMDPTGPVIYQRGNRNPNAGTWDIR